MINEKNEITVDESKVNVLMHKIIMMEKSGIQTHKGDSQMIADIQKAIEEAVKCYSNQ